MLIKTKLLFLLLFLSISLHAQPNTQIYTADIDHFWEAYDRLPECKTKADSINNFQVHYIDRATDGFKSFLKIRNFKAREYYILTKRYPKFWQSIRANTLRVKNILGDLEEVYTNYEKAFPGHEKPKVCFAIGALRTGGTVSDGYLLIGTEITAADRTTDKSELSKWLQSVMTDEFEIRSMIAHEYVHALQKINFGAIWAGLNHRVLMMALNEGAADFLAKTITGITINKNVYEFGNAHEAEIWTDFKKDMWGKNFQNWLYQGHKAKGERPADLGYFIGYKICESYYQKAKDQQKALKKIAVIKSYKKLYRKSGYDEKPKNSSLQHESTGSFQ